MRLIDADAIKTNLVKALYELNGDIFEAIDVVENKIDDASTVDAVEVVRCKDCYYCTTEKSFGKEYLYCDAFYERAEGDLIGVSLMVEPNHFCSWAEKMDEVEDGNDT